MNSLFELATTLIIIDGSAPNIEGDRLNDNLMV